MNYFTRIFHTSDQMFINPSKKYGVNEIQNACIKFAKHCGLKVFNIKHMHWDMSGNRFQFIRYYFGDGKMVERSWKRIFLFLHDYPK